MLLGGIPDGGPLAQEPRSPAAPVCGPWSCRVRPVRAGGSRPSAQGGPGVRTDTTVRHHGEAARVRPTALGEKAARRGTTLTGDANSVARCEVAVEHGGPAATPAARAPATAEEETVALSSGVESGGDLRGRRRRWRAGTGRGGQRWRAADAYPRERRRWHTASDRGR
jgi:hypothetical protein